MLLPALGLLVLAVVTGWLVVRAVGDEEGYKMVNDQADGGNALEAKVSESREGSNEGRVRLE